MLPVTPPPAEPKVWRGWSEQKMNSAVELYRAGGVSIREAARRYDQTDSFYRTLQRRLEHQPSTHKLPHRPGPPTLFSNEQEESLIQWIVGRQRIRYPPTKQQILAKAAAVAAGSAGPRRPSVGRPAASAPPLHPARDKRQSPHLALFPRPGTRV